MVIADVHEVASPSAGPIQELRVAGRALEEVEDHLRAAWQGALAGASDDDVERIVDAWRAVHRANRAIDELVGTDLWARTRARAGQLPSRQ